MSVEKMKIIKSIHKQIYAEQEYTDAQIKLLFKFLSTHQRDTVCWEALIAVIEGGDAVIDYMLDHFDEMTSLAKTLAVPMLASTDYVRSYAFCIDRLRSSVDEEEAMLIIDCLAETHYMIVPLVVDRLLTDSHVFLERLKILMKCMGFVKFQTYLTLMPQFPHERVFRSVFGDAVVDQIKQ